MNPEQILNAVETAIANRKHSKCDRWFLCWKDGQIEALPIETIPRPKTRFFTFTRTEIEKGFSKLEWDTIQIKLTCFLHQKGLL